MKNLSDDASLPEVIPELEAEIATIDAALDDLDISLRQLLAAENPEAGRFHAQEIHVLRQRKLMLETRRELRRVRIRRLLRASDVVMQ